MPHDDDYESGRSRRQTNELVLFPGQYAYIQDKTNGVVTTHVGPCLVALQGTERPVIFDPKTGSFSEVRLDDAAQKNIKVPEGFYAVLDNPSTEDDRARPRQGQNKGIPSLRHGHSVIIQGPVDDLPLWPGQTCDVIEGHNLRSNEYILCRVVNEEEARKNWSAATVATKADGEGGDGDESSPVTAENTDLSVGTLFVIKGTNVSFYIPPTGVQVIPEGGNYVRSAVTLERLEYAILVGENGVKRYEKGPQVVFPEPTEVFTQDQDGNRKFRAIELNPIQAIHVKITQDYKDETGDHKAGDELFITGTDCPIYFPRDEHNIISYGGRLKHFATAIPSAAEGRYVMDRLKGKVTLIKGPAMLLPDPRTEVIVRRILSESECRYYYPGNEAAMAHNMRLASMLGSEKVLTDESLMSRGAGGRSRKRDRSLHTAQDVARTANAPEESFEALYDDDAPVAVAAAFLGEAGAEGFQGERRAGSGKKAIGSFDRGTQYTRPRELLLDTKFDGAVRICPWTGYAVQVVSQGNGARRVVEGPATILLEYDETLEVISLSTQTPKTDDTVVRTVYLKTKNNQVSDVVTGQSADHVNVSASYSLRVNFDPEYKDDWFAVENYIKLLTDHVRSVLQGVIKSMRVEEFHKNYVNIIRDAILGVKPESYEDDDGNIVNPPRSGMFFPENGMRVTDVSVVGCQIGDRTIAEILEGAQHDAVRGDVNLHRSQKTYEIQKQVEELERLTAESKHRTVMQQIDLTAAENEATARANLANAKAELEATQAAETIRDETAKRNLQRREMDAASALQIRQRQDQHEESLAEANLVRHEKTVNVEAEAKKAVLAAVDGDLATAISSLGDATVMERVMTAISPYKVLGGNLREVLGDILGPGAARFLSRFDQRYGDRSPQKAAQSD